MANDLRDRIATFFQKNVANPLMRLMPFQTLLETTGRKSGEPRRTPLGGAGRATSSGSSPSSATNRSTSRTSRPIPRVRVRLKGKWHTGDGPVWCPTTIRKRGCVAAAVQQFRRADVRDEPADDPRRFRGLTQAAN